MNLKVIFFLCMLALAGCQGENREVTGFAAAERAAEEYDWEEAVRLLHRYFREDDGRNASERLHAWELLVRSSKNLGEWGYAAEYLTMMLEEYRNDKEVVPAILKELGLLYEKGNQTDRAMETWLTLLDLNCLSSEESARLYLHMGVYNQIAGNYSLAEEMLMEGLVRTAEGSLETGLRQALMSEYQYYLASGYAVQENWKKAEQQASAALVTAGSEYPEIRAQLYILLSEIYDAEEEPVKALAILREALGLHPNPMLVQKRLSLLESKG